MADVMVDLALPFTDERGYIQPLVDFPIGSVLVISSKSGSIRGNHYHKEDFHYSYLASGRMLYYHRPAGRPYHNLHIPYRQSR